MNKVILMGRLTRDPEIRYANNENNTCIANYTSVQVVKEFIHLLEEEAVYAEQQEIETFGKE